MKPAIRKPHEQGRAGVAVLHKALDILENLKQDPGGARLSELARSVDLPKATVYRVLATLEMRGYLDRTGAGGYRMGKKFFDLRRHEPMEQALYRTAHEPMAELVEATKETANLGIVDAGEIVVIHTVESPQAVRMSSKVGNRRYLHSTALGKVMLAGMAESEVRRLSRLRGLPELTEHTIVSAEALLDELRRVREQGFAIDNQENELDGRCVAAPVHGPDGAVIAALSVSGPVFRMSLQRAHTVVGCLIEACDAISARIRS